MVNKSNPSKGRKYSFVLPTWEIQLPASHMFSTFSDSDSKKKKKKVVKIEGEKTAVKIIADSNVKLKYGILAWMIYIKIIQFFLQFWLGMLRIMWILPCPWSLQINFKLIVLNRAAERKVLAIQKVKILVKESINLKEIKGANLKASFVQ